MPALMIRERLHTLKQLGHREANVIRGVVDDVRDRARGHEPRHTKHLGGSFGRRGSLLKSPMLIVVKTLDNFIEFGQENARINRRQLPHKKR